MITAPCFATFTDGRDHPEDCFCDGTGQVPGWACVICGEVDPAGLGHWAFHEGDEHVHRGRCWAAFRESKAIEAELERWQALGVL